MTGVVAVLKDRHWIPLVAPSLVGHLTQPLKCHNGVGKFAGDTVGFKLGDRLVNRHSLHFKHILFFLFTHVWLPTLDLMTIMEKPVRSVRATAAVNSTHLYFYFKN